MKSEKSDENRTIPFLNADLKYAIENGIIDVSQVQQMVEMSKRKELLEKHPFQIWQGKNGKWYVYLPDPKKGRVQKERNTRKEIEDLVANYQKQQIENPTLDEVWEEACAHRSLTKNVKSASLSREQRFYKRHFSVFGQRRIRDLGPEDYVDFIEKEVARHHLTRKGFNGLKGVVRMLLKRAKRRAFINWPVENIFEDLDISDHDFSYRMPEDRDEVFTEDETRRIARYLEMHLDEKNRCLLLILVSGIRIGEAVALKKSDIEGDVLFVRRTETMWIDADGSVHIEVREGTKTDGVRSVVIHESFKWLLDQIANHCGKEWLFENSRGHRQVSKYVRDRFKSVCEKCGVRYRSPHKLRKTYGTILMDNIDSKSNVGEKFVLSQMGHAEIAITKRHYYKDRKTIEQRRNIVNGIREFDWLSHQNQSGQR